MSRLTKIIFTVSGIGFLLNAVWENLQAPLYQGYTDFWQHLSICSVASLGDVLIILVIYFILAIINRDVFWVTKMSRVDVILVITLGVLIAVGIEKWALDIGRWQYVSSMPLIPYTNVGLLPILQMAILPWATYLFTRKYT